MRIGKFFDLVWNIFGKQDFEAQRNARLKFRIDWKHGKAIFFKWVFVLEKMNIFPDKTKRSEKRVLQGIQSQNWKKKFPEVHLDVWMKSISRERFKFEMYKNKWKTNIWCFDLGKKWFFFFQKIYARTIGDNFFFWSLLNEVQLKVL